jgi:hypothetical protein
MESLLFSPEFAATAWRIVLDYALKGVLLLLLVEVLALLFRRASAAVRHLLWGLGLALVLMAPVLPALVPGFAVPPECTAHF